MYKKNEKNVRQSDWEEWGECRRRERVSKNLKSKALSRLNPTYAQ